MALNKWVQISYFMAVLNGVIRDLIFGEKDLNRN